jgi:integrase
VHYQVRAIIGAAAQPWKTFFTLAAMTAMRAGELLGLQIGNLDFEPRVIQEDLLRRRHLSVAELGKWLRSVVRGYFNYHAVPGESGQPTKFSVAGDPPLDACASASQPKAPDNLASTRRSCGSLASPTCHPSSLSQRAFDPGLVHQCFP